MNLTFDTTYFYPLGFEIAGSVEVDATLNDDSFSYSYGSINAVHRAESLDVDFVRFVPLDVAGDVRAQLDVSGLSRKRARKLRRQMLRAVEAELEKGEKLFAEWLKAGGDREIDNAIDEARHDHE